MQNIELRAISAYTRRCQSNPTVIYQQPGPPAIREVGGKSYVVLSNTRGLLAVYRIKPDGFLKHLDRYPKEFDAEFE